MGGIFRIIFCCIVFLLDGCTAQIAHVYHARERSACINSCMQQFKICQDICHNNCRECSQSNNFNAKRNYNIYVNETYVRGGTISRNLNSYSDPLKCKKITCDCRADLTICRQACNGQIKKRLQVAPLCC
jgi:hypothetical protein